MSWATVFSGVFKVAALRSTDSIAASGFGDEKKPIELKTRERAKPVEQLHDRRGDAHTTEAQPKHVGDRLTSLSIQ